ncbi:MAG: T9SS type A sorting domain-containing protein [Chitinophagales bacterium]|nr:T9SS type A sorting domain-containing protein [Chitinophagales bacterium]
MKKICFILLFQISWSAVFSQFPNIKIDDSGNPEEPSIFINPKNTDNRVAGANINFAYNSFDAGRTWVKQELYSDWGVWGDPCIITDTAGRFYFFHLSNPLANGNWIDRIICERSEDGGNIWSNKSFTGLNGTKAQDKAWSCVNPKTNEIYVTWTQFDKYGSADPTDSSNILFSKTQDEGITWSVPLRINRKAGDCLDSDNTAEGAVPCIGSNGEIFVVWSKSDSLLFNRSTDDGATWLSENIVVAAQPGGWDYSIPGYYRCNGMPVTRCDLSASPNHGTIYVNWSDQRNGEDNTDVWLAASTDGGNTWSAPKKVNDDVSDRHQFLSWLDVDRKTGYVYIIFYDRRNYGDWSTDVYLAYSTDGGNTFVNDKISDLPFYPDNSVFLGDYNNLSAYDGKIAPIWTRQDNAISSVMTAEIDFSTLAGSAPSLSTGQFMLFQNYPNPFSSATNIKMKIKQSGNYSLVLYDLFGKKVASLFSEKYLSAGTHNFSLNSAEYHLPGNEYYYTLYKGNEATTKKLIFLYH